MGGVSIPDVFVVNAECQALVFSQGQVTVTPVGEWERVVRKKGGGMEKNGNRLRVLPVCATT